MEVNIKILRWRRRRRRWSINNQESLEFFRDLEYAEPFSLQKKSSYDLHIDPCTTNSQLHCFKSSPNDLINW